jgi:hypothetical protein
MNSKSKNEYDTYMQSQIGINAAFKTAQYLYDEIKKGPDKDYLVPSFIASICAGIEGSINNIYISFLFQKFGSDYKSYVEPLLGIRGIKNKMKLLVPLISAYKYVLNEHNDTLQEIIRLFEMRNTLIHVRHHWFPVHIVQNEGELGLNMTYLTPDKLGPYDKGLKEYLTEHDYLHFMNISNEFQKGFYSLRRRMNRKNFKPEPWFKKTKKAKSKP